MKYKTMQISIEYNLGTNALFVTKQTIVNIIEFEKRNKSKCVRIFSERSQLDRVVSLEVLYGTERHVHIIHGILNI